MGYKIFKAYSITYILGIHIIAIYMVMIKDSVDFTQNTADIILSILGYVFIFCMFELAFFIPSILIIGVATVTSFAMAVSIPAFLFLSLFEVCGSEIINVLQYGFFKTLLICFACTPFGIANLIAVKDIF